MKSSEELGEKNQLNGLSERIGILLPGQTPTVKAISDGFAISAGFGKARALFPFFILTLILLFPWLILIISPNNPEKIKKILPMLICLLIFAGIIGYPAIKLIFKKGLFRWYLSSNIIRISYKTKFKTNVVELLLQDLFLKLYMYKGNHRKLNIQHGWYVLSLCSKISDDEIFISSFKRKKRATILSRKLGLYVPLQMDIEEPNNAPLDDDTDKDTWDVMVAKTAKKPLFTPQQADYTKSIRVCEKNEIKIIKRTLLKWIPFTICIGIVVVPTPFAILLFKDELQTMAFTFKPLETLIFIGMLSMLIFLVGGGFSYVIGVNSVIIDSRKQSVIIKYGWWFKNIQLSLHSEKLNCRLFTCDKVYSNKTIKPGMTILALSNEFKDKEIIIAASDKRDKIDKAFNLLSEFLGNTTQDESLCQLELPFGKTLQYSTSCIKDEEEFSSRSLKILNNDVAVLKRNDFYLVLFLGGIVMGGWMISVLLTKTEESHGIGEMIFIVSVGLLMLGLSLYCFLQFLITRTIGFCRSDDIVYHSIFANRKFYCKKEAKVSEIAALQICSASTTVQSGNSARNATVFQLIGIMSRGNNDREFICGSTRADKIFDAAEKLRDFLDLPLIDNTQ